jgi:hypothetical protein
MLVLVSPLARAPRGYVLNVSYTEPPSRQAEMRIAPDRQKRVTHMFPSPSSLVTPADVQFPVPSGTAKG